MDKIAGLRLLGEFAQDVAATFGLGYQKFGIFAQGPLRRFAHHFLGNDRDGGQRRAQFMRRRRR